MSESTTTVTAADTGLAAQATSALVESSITAAGNYSMNTSMALGTWLYRALSVAMPGNTTETKSALEELGRTHGLQATTMLSDLKILRNFTRWPKVNRIIIATLEGQIITIVVVACFILIFLIREWVVQQQPGINVGAGFNADFPVGGRVQRLAAAVENEQQPAPEGIAVLQPQPHDEVLVRHRPRVGNNPRGFPLEQRHARQDMDDTPAAEDTSPADTLADSDLVRNANARQQRPIMPVRDALSGATEIQRRLTEVAIDSSTKVDAAAFLSVWQRAKGDFDEIARIIDEEGLDEKLRDWNRAMKHVTARQRINAEQIVGQSSAVGDAGQAQRHLDVQETRLPARAESDGSDLMANTTSGEEESPSGLPFRMPSLRGKGKERASPSTSEDEAASPNDSEDGRMMQNLGSIYNPLPRPDRPDAWPSHSSSGRPRAISDGPPLRPSISPLANDNWSFSAAPKASDELPSLSGVPGEGTSSDAFLYDPGFPIRGGGNSTAHSSMPADHTHQSPLEGSSRPKEPDNPIELRGQRGGLPYDTPEETGQRLNALEHSQSSNYAPQSEVSAASDDPPIHEAAQAAPPNQPLGIYATLVEWIWGDMGAPADNAARDDERLVENVNDEPPFVAVQAHGPVPPAVDGIDGADDDQDIEVLEAARAAGIDPNDPDAMDDAEDFEGIMELVGMRGPLIALLQNALFSAVLISLTLVCGVWIPYNFGRLCLLLLANPIHAAKLPLKIAFSIAAVLQDLTIAAAGLLAWAVVNLFVLLKSLVSIVNGPKESMVGGSSESAVKAIKVASEALGRIMDGILGVIVQLPDSEVPQFSALSHESLLHIKATIHSVLHGIGSVMASLAPPVPGELSKQSFFDPSIIRSNFMRLSHELVMLAADLPRILGKSDSWIISLNNPSRTSPIDIALSAWGSADRFWAIVSGYVGFCFIGAAYIRKGSPFSSSRTVMEWEATMIDILHQAGGVMKVILIISIEMLVFPLYCGMLLDLALLPLFDHATISSRLIFTVYTPLTSVFIHWFVGTCYMFHFALFVSMCRKIMRAGVLYFIRDPDDPTFHPVRDVLERNVSTQLRKITFSAMVYGALVMVCLGGVVWSLAFAFEGVLPIHWSSNEPVLEFPVDLLFYNFFMPLTVNFFQPADGLHAMYSWWFRRCARFLRLTWFLFDERRMDEEGYHVRKSFRDFIRGATAKVIYAGDTGYPILDQTSGPNNDIGFVRDGRYVKAPGTDQVRLPKGSKVFVEIENEKECIDGLLTRDENPHGQTNELFKLVYVPPHFRIRISLFILLIWLFAAATGVSITIVPLVFGRYAFARLTPRHVQTNDVYAFSIGVYGLGAALYSTYHAREGYKYLRQHLQFNVGAFAQALATLNLVMYRLARLVYFYSATAILLPILLGFMVDFYLIIPLNTLTSGPHHTIHVVQTWVLGLLYLKMITRVISRYTESRPAEALRAVARQGYLNPDVRIATRCFIFPATVALSMALLLPPALASIAMYFEVFSGTVTKSTELRVYRYAYPLAMSLVMIALTLVKLWGLIKGWRLRIRDEHYLIGERLHNLDDVRRRGTSAVGAMAIPGSSRLVT